MKKIYTYFLTAVLALGALTSRSQSLGNNTCATAVAVPTNGTCVSGNNTTATATGDGTVSCYTVENGIWFTFVAPATGKVTITTDDPATNFDSQLTLYSGTCGSLTELDCDDDGGSGNTALINATCLVPGATYYVQMDGYAGDIGNFCIKITAGTTPVNDLCSCATTLPQDGTCLNNQTTVNATENFTGAVGCQSAQHVDVWYTFVATQTSIDITTTSVTMGGNVEMVLGTFGGNCESSAFNYVVSPQHYICGASPQTLNVDNLTIGQTYYVLVSSSGSTGTFNICGTSYTPPPDPGQDCPTASVLCNDATFGQPTSNAGFGVQEVDQGNSCWLGGGERQSRWYKFTAGTSGTLEFALIPVAYNSGTQTGDDYDFAIWDITSPNTCPTTATTVAPIACNWDPCTGATGVATNPATSFGLVGGTDWQNNNPAGTLDCSGASTPPWQFDPTINVTAGNTYAVLIDNYSTSNSGFSFEFGGTAEIGPTAGFSATTSCLTVTCIKTTSTSNSTFLWNFGDGTTATTANSATHTYAAAGTYTVTLTVTDALGCTSGSQQVVTVDPLSLTLNPNEKICAGQSVVLTASGVPSSTNVTFSNTTDYNISSSGTPTVTSPIVVSGFSGTVGTSLVSVNLNISHTYDGDLDLILQCPNGTQIILSDNRGGSANNFVNTTFATGGAPIAGGAAPFTGTFAPEVGQAFSNLSGCNLNGTWNLIVVDGFTGDGGVINDWSISFTNTINYTWAPGTGLSGTTGSSVTANPGTTTTYTVSAVDAAGCTETGTVTVTVDPSPNMTSPSTATICSGDQLNIPLTSDVPSTYTWIATTNNTNISGESLTSQTTSTINNTLTSSVTTVQTVTYSVTPTSTANSCPGPVQNVTVTINPKPVIAAVANQSFCANVAVSIPISVSPSGTINWTNSDATNSIGLGASGSGSPISFTAANVSSATTVTVSLNSTVSSCPATQVQFAITINPGPTVTSSSTATVCSGVALNHALTANQASPTFTWIAGDNVNTTGESLTTQNTSTINNTITNNTTSAQTVTYTVTPTASGCAGTAQTVTVTVNPAPTVTSANTTSVCSGVALNYSLTSSVASTFTWIAGDNVNTTGESLTSQSGSTVNNTIVNNTSSAQVVTYTVTPTASTGSCAGTPQTLSVTVNPRPTVTSANTTSVCSGVALNYGLTATPASNFTWIAADNANTTGESTTTQSSNTINNTIINSSNSTAQQVIYTVTPTSTASSCAGTAQTLTVTVNPAPTVTSTNTTTVCSGVALNYPLTSSTPSTFTWIASNNVNTTGESTTTQSGATVNNTITNGTASAEVVTYTITPTATTGSCAGSTQTLSVTVNPAPTVTSANTTSICSGVALSYGLTSSTPSTFTWIAAANANTTGESTTSQSTSTVTDVLVNTTATSQVVTYTVTPTASTGSCAGTAQTLSVTVNPAPTVTSAATTSVCSGVALNYGLTATPASNFTWVAADNANTTGESTTTQSSNTINNTIINSSSAAAEQVVYTVTPTSAASSCAGTAQTLTVTVNPAPTVTSANTTSVCSGVALNYPLTSSTPSTFTWIASNNANTTGESTTSQSGATVNNTITNGTASAEVVTYTITPTATTGSCAGSTQTLSVTVNPAPTVTSAAAATVCSGVALSHNITSSSPSTFTWIASNNTNTTGESTTSQATGTINDVINNPTSTVQTITYTITPTATTGTCLGTSQTFTATVNPLPSAVGTSTAVCSGSLMPAMNFTTTPSTNVTINWTNSNTAIGLAASGTGNITGYTAPVVGAQEVGTISVVATNTVTGCVSSSAPAATFTVNPNPTISTVATPANPSTCGGTDGSLTGFSAAVAISYSWNGGAPSGSSDLTNIPAGSYSVVATDANGCQVSASYSLTDPTSPAPPPFTVTPTSLCVGGSATFTVNSPVGGETYNWTGPNGSLGTGNSITINPVTLADAGVYNVFTTAAGCTGSVNTAAAVTLTVNANPTAQVSNTVFSFCQQSDVVLQSNSLGGGAATITSYQWYDASGAIVGATGATYTVTTPGTYSLQVTNSNGCSNTSAGYPVTFFNEPDMSGSAPTSVNSSCTSPTGSLSGVTVVSGTADYTYSWYGSSGLINSTTIASPNAPDLTGQGAGTYTLTVVDNNGCNDTITGVIVNDNAPSQPLIATNNPNCAGSPNNPITLTGGAGTFTWYSDAGLTTVIGSGNPFTPATVSTATVYVTETTNGCASPSTQVVVTVNPKPAAPASVGDNYCVGETINDLVVTSAVSGIINWYSNSSLTTQVGSGTPYASGISNTIPGTTTLYVAETALGCLGDPTTVTVTVNENPVIDISALTIDSASCGATATDGGLGGVTVTGNPGFTYVWSNAGGVVSTSVSTTDLTGQPVGSYTLSVTDVNGCVTAQGPLNITSSSTPATPSFVTASDTTYCDGETVGALSATGPDIEWYADALLTNLMGSGNSFTPTGITTDTTIYLVSNTNFCLSLPRAVNIVFNPLPTVSANSPSVCQGSQATLSGTGASTYTWDNGVTDGVAFTPVVTGPYVVTGTDANGCVNTGTVTVTVNQLPTVGANVGATADVCSNSSVTLTGTGAVTYTWDNGVVDGVPFTPPASGPYVVTGTDANSCSNTFTVTVTVNTLPTVTVNSTGNTVCAGGQVTLSGSGATTYTWDNGVTDGVAFTPAASGPYVVTGTDNNGCVNTATVTVTVNNLPTVSANSPSVCQGSQATLSGTGASTYTWDNGVIDGVAFTPVVTGPYVVTGTDVNGCVNTGTVTVTVNQLPTVGANVGATADVCSNSSVTLTGTGAVTYTWDNGVVDGVPFTPPASGPYVVTGTDANSCSNTFTVTVTVNTLPTVTVNSTGNTVCAGGQVTLSGSGATTYTWDNGVTDGVAFTPAASGPYVVTGTDNNGCVNTATVTVTVNSLPTVGGNNATVCQGGQVTLNGSGALTYTWDSGIPDGTPFTPALTGPYVVTGTDANGCVNTATVTVTVNPLPTVGANTGSVASVCGGTSITLSGTGASTYAWNNGVFDGISFTPTSSGTYIVTGTDANSCTNTFTVSVTVNNLPTVSVGVSASIPCGSTSSVLNAATTNATSPVYTWTGPGVIANGNTAAPTVGAAGQYTLTVLDNATGCSASATLDVTSDAVTAAFTPDVTSGFVPLSVNFSNQSTGALTYFWNFDDGNFSTAATPTNVFTVMGTYNVVLVATSNGCSDTAYATIMINDNSSIIIPNIFSPNADGINDELIIKSTGLKELNIDIFNRWGQKVYVIDRPGQNWDGLLSNGEQAAEGTYFYILKATGYDTKTYEAQGPVMLVK